MGENDKLAVVSDATGTVQPHCPPWCLGETFQGKHHVHESDQVEWHGPEGRSGSREPAALTASIALMNDDEAESESPEIWFGSAGNWSEFDMPGLERVIAELDRYTVDLQALQYRYAAVLAGTNVSSQPVHASDSNRLIEVTAPCPYWCACRSSGTHNEKSLQDRAHFADFRIIPLSMHRPDRDAAEAEVVPDELQVVLGQYAYAAMPTIDLIIEGRTGGVARLSLGEAAQLRGILGQLIAVAETCATPDALPPLDSVAADLRTKVSDDPHLDPRSSGYALGSSDADGSTWACVPIGLSPALREETVRDLMACIYERRGRTLWEGDCAPCVMGDRAALIEATKRAAA
ncbi:DUF6907 domain-containing protein [Streptomyces sp. BYX5S]